MRVVPLSYLIIIINKLEVSFYGLFLAVGFCLFAQHAGHIELDITN